MKLPVEKGADAPVIFLEVLLLFISGYISLMFYIQENFIAAVVSFVVTLLITWQVLDRSVF